ncbi:hypothetical protein ACF3NR_05560 [Vaginella massiliensis]|nr:hypothetical protein [Vaginella massiliensis]
MKNLDKIILLILSIGLVYLLILDIKAERTSTSHQEQVELTPN